MFAGKNTLFFNTHIKKKKNGAEKTAPNIKPYLMRQGDKILKRAKVQKKSYRCTLFKKKLYFCGVDLVS